MYGYADTSFATNADMTSTNRNMFILNGAAITWNSKRQQTVALSTAEAEYMYINGRFSARNHMAAKPV